MRAGPSLMAIQWTGVQQTGSHYIHLIRSSKLERYITQVRGRFNPRVSKETCQLFPSDVTPWHTNVSDGYEYFRFSFYMKTLFVFFFFGGEVGYITKSSELSGILGIILVLNTRMGVNRIYLPWGESSWDTHDVCNAVSRGRRRDGKGLRALWKKRTG